MNQIKEDIILGKRGNERLVWVDWAKALAIVMMVLGHGTAPAIIIKYVYAFHMPAFFIISGYLYRPKSFHKVLKSFGIPILVFGFINYLFSFYVNLRAEGDSMLSFKTLLLIPLSFPGFWFIRTLFLARVISGDIIKKKYDLFIPILAVLSILTIICIEIGVINDLPRWLFDLVHSYPFFVIGFLMKKYKYSITQKPFLLIIETLFFLVVPCLFNKFDLGEHQFGPSYFIFMSLSVSSSLLFFNVCSILPQYKIVALLSEGTLVVLGVHRICMRCFYQLYKYLPLEWILSLATVTILSWQLIILCKKKFPILMGK